MKDVKAELVRNALQNCSKLNNKSNCTGFLISEARHPGLFHKKIIVENFAKFTRKHLCQSLQNFIKKENSAQVLSSESFEILDEIFFREHFLATASIICIIVSMTDQLHF